MAVEVGHGSGLDAGNGETETDHAGTVVGSENVATDFTDHHQEAQGEQFEIGKAPDLTLKIHNPFEFVEVKELPDLY